MAFTITCPYCGTVFQATACGTTCRNPACKAKISVDSKGNITRSQPGKK